MESINSFFWLLNLFVLGIAVITMGISFFLLLVSCKTNIAENSWELGVLRALGLDKGQLTRVYLYESLVSILASSLLGSFIGICSALTLTL